MRHGPRDHYVIIVLPIYKGPTAGHATKRHAGRTDVNEQELRKRLEMLRSEHRDLDAAIAALSQPATPFTYSHTFE